MNYSEVTKCLLFTCTGENIQNLHRSYTLYIWPKNIGSFHAKRTRVTTSTFRILIKFYQLLQIPYEQGSAKFQLQIINGWCPSNTDVEVTFCRCGVVHDKQQSFKLFYGITGQATIIKFGVPTNPCELNAKRILPLLKFCHDFYYAQSSTKISA